MKIHLHPFSGVRVHVCKRQTDISVCVLVHEFIDRIMLVSIGASLPGSIRDQTVA